MATADWTRANRTGFLTAPPTATRLPSRSMCRPTKPNGSNRKAWIFTLIRLNAIFAALACFHVGAARADDVKTVPRLMTSMGPWISKFRQTNGSYTAQVTSKSSVGFDFAAGLKVGSFFFAELTAAAFFPAYSAGPKARDANYFSPYGL